MSLGSDTVLEVKLWHCMMGIEGLTRLKHTVDQVDELSHEGTNNEFGVLPFAPYL